MKRLLNITILIILIASLIFPNISFAIDENDSNNEDTNDKQSATNESAEIIQTLSDSDIEYKIEDLEANWKNITDEELNLYIQNLNSTELKTFLNSLTEDEEILIKSKKTILNNQTKIGQSCYNGAPYEVKTYYEYLKNDSSRIKLLWILLFEIQIK